MWTLPCACLVALSSAARVREVSTANFSDVQPQEIHVRHGVIRDEHLVVKFGKYHVPPGKSLCGTGLDPVPELKQQAMSILLIMTTNDDSVGQIDDFVGHCMKEGTFLAPELEQLLEDRGVIHLPPKPPVCGAWGFASQRKHRDLLVPLLKKELKNFARTGAERTERQLANVRCTAVPGSQPQGNKCVCTAKKHVIKGFAPHCRVKNVQEFEAKNFVGCVCMSPYDFVSGDCMAFGAKKGGKSKYTNPFTGKCPRTSENYNCYVYKKNNQCAAPR